MCDSIDCPITYARTQAVRDADDLVGVREVLGDVQDGEGEGEGEEVMIGGKKPFWEALEW